MSTAKSSSTAKEAQLTSADFADILSTTLAMAAEAGLSVGVRNRPARDEQPGGLLILISGLSVGADGRLTADETDPAPLP